MGLQAKDLRNMVYHIFEIDSYASKMGDDQDIVTLSFSVKTKEAADDLSNFLEKGYSFILDSDVTPGEQSDGTYKVFVEIERAKEVPDQIMEMLDGVGKLSGIDTFKFRYYKNFRSIPSSIDSLSETVPTDSDSYGVKTSQTTMENYKNFFSNSYLESVDMLDDIITINKAWADPLHFKFEDFGDKEEVLENLKESININNFAEIIFLSKYIGDYNITQFGNKLMFENGGKALVATRLYV